MKKAKESIFYAIVFCFSALTLVFSLLLSIKITAEGDTAAELEAQLKEAQKENEILIAKYESKISLEDIERYATEVFGMQRCDTSQIILVTEQPD